MRRAITALVSLLLMLGTNRAGYSQATPATSTVTISSSGAPTSGTMTITVGGHFHTVSYGPYSTPAAVASAFAAAFSSYPAFAWPKLCSVGICAKANGATIQLQMLNGTGQPISITSSSTAFNGTASGWTGGQQQTQVLLGASPASAQYGAAVNFTAYFSTSSPTPTGAVEFYDGTSSLGSININPSGIATLSNSVLSVGAHSITAVYSGDSNYLGSTAAPLSESIYAAPTTIGLATSGTPVNHGTSVTFTATISSGPSGVLTFHDGNSVLGAATISAGVATFTTSGLSAGSHAITASWAGTSDYAPATSPTLTVNVNGIQVSAQPGVITTVAGIGTRGFSGDGGPAIAAGITDAWSLTTDGANNLYFCDNGARIREVAAATGTISTIAGNGTTGYSGDGQLATDAEISCRGVVADAAGNIYFADRTSARIRKVSVATGIISTIAGNGTFGYSGDGGLAINASIAPLNVAIDAAGDLYFFNTNGEYKNSDGSVNPDFTISSLRMVSISTGAISTVSDPPIPGIPGSHAGLISCTDDGIPTSAPFGSCAPGFVVDGQGNIYVDLNSAVFKIPNSGSAYSVIAGTPGQGGTPVDGGSASQTLIDDAVISAIDSSGNLYLSGDGPLLRKINAATGIISVVAQRGYPGIGCSQQTDAAGDGCLAIDSPTPGPTPSLPITGYGVSVDGNGTMYTVDGTVIHANGLTYDGDGTVIRAIAPPLSAEIQDSVVTSGCPSTVAYGTPVKCSVGATSGATGAISLAYQNNATSAITFDAPEFIASGAPPQVLSTAALPVGMYTVLATYGGDTNYLPSIAQSTLTITKATPVLTWATPASSISEGTPLSSQQLNATSTVPGQFTYTPSFGAVLPVGSNTLSVKFVPTDGADYSGPVTSSQTVTVTQDTPKVTWGNPAPIQYGTALSSIQLDATANVPGTFVYTPPSGTVLPMSTTVPPQPYALSVTFTPTTSSNNANNNPITISAYIQVVSDSPIITGILPAPAAVGTTVTIVGNNFGPSQGSGTLTISGISAPATAWTDTSITAAIPSGATTGDAVVNVGGVSSNGFLLLIPKSCP